MRKVETSGSLVRTVERVGSTDCSASEVISALVEAPIFAALMSAWTRLAVFSSAVCSLMIENYENEKVEEITILFPM